MVKMKTSNSQGPVQRAMNSLDISLFDKQKNKQMDGAESRVHENVFIL